MRLFRERLLGRLNEKHAISQELATKLMAWRHAGFQAHAESRYRRMILRPSRTWPGMW